MEIAITCVFSKLRIDKRSMRAWLRPTLKLALKARLHGEIQHVKRRQNDVTKIKIFDFSACRMPSRGEIRVLIR